MVNVLLKHELKAYLRTIIPMNVILIAVALLSRIIQIFDNNSDTYNIVFGSSIFVFCVGIIVSLVLTFIFSIKRFYTNLFTAEGYLTLTLPVTSTTHILTKVIVATLSIITSFIMIAVSVCVITFGDVCIEIFKAVAWLFKELFETTNLHSILYIIEFIILFIVSIMVSFLLFYACIALGQRAKKNRVAAAVGIYFAYYFIIQIISTILMTLLTSFYMYLPLEQIAEFVDKYPQASVHIFLCLLIIGQSIIGAIYFLITRHTINKKLNLE